MDKYIKKDFDISKTNYNYDFNNSMNQTKLETIDLNNNIFLSTNNKQDTLLTTLSYLDIDEKNFLELKKKDKVTLNDLKNITSNGNNEYLGSGAKLITGIDTTTNQIIDDLIDHDLGNLEIIDVKSTSNGFYGIVFKDELGNIGISYRGTDVANPKDLVVDSYNDVKEFLSDNTKQVNDAQELFDKYKNDSNNISIYGHSLGGNIAEHIYLNNSNYIDKVFVVNALPISKNLLNTNEKVELFNNPNKFNCYVIDGDWVSNLKDKTPYENNIKYIQNNNKYKDSTFTDHAMESALYDANGNFKIINKSNSIHKHTITKGITGKMGNAGETVNNIFN